RPRRPRAEDGDALRELAEARAFFVRPEAGLVQPVELRDLRDRTDRDDEVARLDIARIAVGANDDPPRPRDLRVAADRHGPRGLVPLDVSGVIGIVAALADDHVVAPRRCSLPGIVTAAGADLRRVQQRLRWHAAPEGARAAEEIALDERDRCATGARVTRRGFARGAGADNREVEPIGHARTA